MGVARCAEEVADHLHGQGHGHLGGEVDDVVAVAPGPVHRVEQSSGQLAHGGFERPDGAGGELAVEHLAVLGVLGRVQAQQHLGVVVVQADGRELGVRRVERRLELVAGSEADDAAVVLVGGHHVRAATQGGDVLVVRHDPEPPGAVGSGVSPHRRLGTLAREPVVGRSLGGPAVEVQQVDLVRVGGDGSEIGGNGHQGVL
ncbi:MAG: hypothetical protein EKK62_11570 [Acidimicrobiia bacterium]|nr:MAG: hypothetical protein EKK62_11570 [Acidimicrobiia bacterium]